MLKIAVCDDEGMFGFRLGDMIRSYVEQRGETCAIDQFTSGIDFLKLGTDIAAYRIVFLDINMGELNGIDTARQLRMLCEDTIVVFVTAFIDYTIEGYKVRAFRYLLKNADNFKESLDECMDAIFQKLNTVSDTREIQFIEGKRAFSMGKLLYVASSLHKVYFHIMEKKRVRYSLLDSLNHIQEQLNSNELVRVHQSYLVNISFIKSINSKEVILTDGTKLPIAKARYRQVKEQITLYKGVF